MNVKIERLFFIFILVIFGSLNSTYSLCPIDFSTPTTAQNVQDRIEQITKYRAFAQNQLSSGTAILEVVSNSVQERWIQASTGFGDVLQRYNINKFSEGDYFLQWVFVAGFDAIRKTVKYRCGNRGANTARKEVDSIISAITSYEGSPLYYPKALENFNIIPDHLEEKIFINWIGIDLPDDEK
ncbi:MAG: hypothetical protein IJ730_02745 [Alphaproteobacteria bacterium]|nr:hypothetical protein [Alphaproteobacteria bacterium]